MEPLKHDERIISLLSSLRWQMVYLLRIFQNLYPQLLTTPQTTIYAILCLFDLILYVQSTIFQLYRDGSSWAEPVLS